MSVPPSGSPVVIYVNGASSSDHGVTMRSVATGASPSVGRGYDPYQVHRDFPERWQAYIRQNYRGISHVCRVFNVTDKTARNWWNGAFGANGGYVAIAVREHGEVAVQMLFAEAA